jgi:micrococcal nuclease
MSNARIEVEVERPVDGDTVRVKLDDGRSESVRIQALDTEESRAGGDKPVTPWGRKASGHAATWFTPGRRIVLDFDQPATGPVDITQSRYRDNFGRLLALVFADGQDFQAEMIERGFSPYFPKYGHVRTREYRRRYEAAERAAQAGGTGFWDQIAVNGSEQRNYAALGTWWALRAEVIEDYRRYKRDGGKALNPRLDHEQLLAMAGRGEAATVFTEFGRYRRLGSRKAVVDIGSVAQPFSVFIPDVEVPSGQGLLNLLEQRYLSGGTEGGATVLRPGRGYGYVCGRLKLFNSRLEILADGPEDVSDSPA